MCVEIVATATGTNFVTAAPQTVVVRLVPVGVILPPAATPSPCITLSPTSPAANIPVLLTAGSLVNGSCTAATSDIVRFDWTFGDGGSASGRTVNHTYSAAGSFVLTLTETSDRGLAASATQQVSIGTPNLPQASFSTSPGSPAVGDTVFFNASASVAGAGHTLTGFSWDFGDGTTGSGMNTTHVYTQPRTYTVLLTVTDESGQSATSAATQLSVGSGAPAAAFTFLLVAGTRTVDFDAGPSTAQPGAQITDWTWTFGDTQSGTGQTTSHTYPAAGTYSVRLTVKDNLGRTASATQSVTVP
jgi:PKD repeat protein